MKKMLFGAVMAIAMFVGVAQTDAAPMPGYEFTSAALTGNIEKVKQGLENGIDQDRLGSVLVKLSACRGENHKEIITLLLQHGAGEGTVIFFRFTGSPADDGECISGKAIHLALEQAKNLNNLEIINLLEKHINQNDKV